MEDRDVEAWRKKMQQSSSNHRAETTESTVTPSDQTTTSSSPNSTSQRTTSTGEDVQIDPAIKKSDLLLNEIAIMCQMCHHYTSSLLESRLGPLLGAPDTGKVFRELTMMAQQLVGELIILESTFMKRNIDVAKASVEPIEMDASGKVMCSSLVEELFYIVRKSFRRSIQSLNMSAAAAIINQIVKTIDENVGPDRFRRGFDRWCVIQLVHTDFLCGSVGF